MRDVHSRTYPRISEAFKGRRVDDVIESSGASLGSWCDGLSKVRTRDPGDCSLERGEPSVGVSLRPKS